jgi:hypothetical protein
MADRGSPRSSLRDGRYVVLDRLGEGRQGTTWDAVDKREGRPVAIKEFDVRGARAWKDVELAEREARVLASLSHPKLPRYIEHFEEDGILYLAMEKIEGTPLSTLRKQGAMREEDVVRLLRDADDVLGYLHGRAPPVVHRDLKPSNVIRRPDGSFAFVDFGAVRDRMQPDGGSTVVGTFGYMAPEQFQGRAGPGSDVYAIGATALALLTGQEPEKLPHRGLTIDVHAALGNRVSRPLRDALVQMLETDPDKRPTRLGPILQGLGKRSEPPPPPAGRARDRERPAPRERDFGRDLHDRIEREIRENVARATRHAARHSAREAKRLEKKAEKWARRRARREMRRHEWDRGHMPWFVVLGVTLGLTLAQIAVVLALRVVVPTVLVLLSLLFGRGVRAAARKVAEAGERARDAMDRARDSVRGAGIDVTEGEADPPRARVAGEPEVDRVRVADDDERERQAALEEAAAEEADRAARRR